MNLESDLVARYRKSDFFPISFNLRQWGTGGESGVFGGRGEDLEGANRKKKIGGKISKIVKNRKNRKKS